MCCRAVALAICRPKLREHIKYVEENPEEISKFAKIKSQVAEVKGVMKDNIDKVCLPPSASMLNSM